MRHKKSRKTDLDYDERFDFYEFRHQRPEMPVKMDCFDSSFLGYLFCCSRNNTHVRDFLRDATSDIDFPKEVDSLESLMRYVLSSRGLSPDDWRSRRFSGEGMMLGAKRCWINYVQRKKRLADKVIK